MQTAKRAQNLSGILISPILLKGSRSVPAADRISAADPKGRHQPHAL